MELDSDLCTLSLFCGRFCLYCVLSIETPSSLDETQRDVASRWGRMLVPLREPNIAASASKGRRERDGGPLGPGERAESRPGKRVGRGGIHLLGLRSGHCAHALPVV